MRKLSLKSKILLGAILMGGSVAGAHTLVNLPSAQETRFNWDGDGPNHSGPLSNATIEEAEIAYGCDGEAAVCAIGERVGNTGPLQAVINLK